jgi:hypothetical protein
MTVKELKKYLEGFGNEQPIMFAEYDGRTGKTIRTELMPACNTEYQHNVQQVWLIAEVCGKFEKD